jgi:hypothetical protein
MHNKQEEKKQFTYFFHSIVLKAISRIFIKVYMHIIDVFNTSGDNVCMMSWRYVETHRDLSILLHWEAHFLFMYFFVFQMLLFFVRVFQMLLFFVHVFQMLLFFVYVFQMLLFFTLLL